MTRYVAVTGCAGFIGKHLTRKLLERGDYVYGIDCLTYAADPQAVEQFHSSDRFQFIGRNIRDLERWPDVDAVLHLAAETHVDNSLTESSRFVETNVNGTLHLLEMTRAKSQHGMPRFIHISTDEVYGSAGKDDSFVPDAPLQPTSPYAASKAGADLLVQSWGTTFSVPYTIVRPTNCYGLGQYPEKLIPKTVRSQMLGRPMTVHGDGSQTRQWLWVEDLADAILHVLDNPSPPIVNVGGNTEASVREIVDFIGGESKDGFTRPACDQRYSVDDSYLRGAGWKPSGDFWAQLAGLVESERQRFRF